LAEIVESVAWLCAAIRKTNSRGIMLLDVKMYYNNYIKLAPLRGIERDIFGIQSCWQQLFKGAMIVDRPVARRGEEAGLEMSFEDMIEIAGVVLEWEIESTAVLLEYSTLLVPTKRSSEGINWHLEPWGADSKDNLLSTVQGYEERLKEDLANLRNERAFLGWNSSKIPVEVLLGTENVDWDVQGSGLTAAAIEVTAWTSNDNTAGVKIGKSPTFSLSRKKGEPLLLSTEQNSTSHPKRISPLY
jgi:hypothetical protein